MSILVQEKFVHDIAPRLDKFIRRPGPLYNFRCVFCGDSVKDKHKARAYLYVKKNNFWYHCHNCNKHTIFDKFLKQFDANKYNEYVFEIISERKPEKFFAKQTIFKHTFSEFPELIPITKLPETHTARRYLVSRKLPDDKLASLFYVDSFKAFTNRVLPKKFESTKHEEPRIIIPFLDHRKDFFGYQGRSLEADAAIRYITIIFNTTKPKVYGLDRVDFNQTYYVFEGPFDSMFLPNAIAACGGSVTSQVQALGSNKANAVLVFDNEPRNKEICSAMQKAINAGYAVFIWPKEITTKDVNDLVINNITPDKIKTIIDQNTYRDIEASLFFNDWKKCKLN